MERDKWATWVGGGRDANDASLAQQTRGLLAGVRDEMLKRISIRPGEHVLDVGTGDGLVGVAALELVGPEGRVTFSDVSQDVIDALSRTSALQQYGRRCQFAVCNGEALEGIGDDSVDVVTARSVAVYMTDRLAFFRSVARVLKESGRVVLYEPIASFFPKDEETFFGWHVKGEAAHLVATVNAVYYNGPLGKANESLLSITVQELIECAEAAGFARVGADIQCESFSPSPMGEQELKRLLHGRPNPNTPSIADVVEESLSEGEREVFLSGLVTAATLGSGRQRSAAVFMTAER